MSKDKNYCGIDVSKDTLDAFNEQTGHNVFENNLKGFRDLLKWAQSESYYVMEATGVYHKKLACFLHNKKCAVSVVNPLIIKRFSQMLLRSTKTDKADAMMICKYAQQNHPSLWNPPAVYIEACLDLNGLLSMMLKQRTALKNKAHALKTKGCLEKKVFRSINQCIDSLNKQIDRLEEDMVRHIEENEADLFCQLKSIPGVGVKTAVFLIVITNGFRQFETSKQLSSYLGMAPSIKTSGSSIKGQSRITKAGNSHIRTLLFFSSFNACKYNPACKELYDRLTGKGKSKKLALIAVANKIIKQAFALSKSGEFFNPQYVNPKYVTN